MLNPGARSRVDSESGTREVSNLIPGWKASEPGCQLCLQTLDPVLSSVSCCSLAFMAYVHSFGQHISQAVSKLSTYSLPGPMDTSHFPLQIMRSMTLTYLSPSSRPQSAMRDRHSTHSVDGESSTEDIRASPGAARFV